MPGDGKREYVKSSGVTRSAGRRWQGAEFHLKSQAMISAANLCGSLVAEEGLGETDMIWLSGVMIESGY